MHVCHLSVAKLETKVYRSNPCTLLEDFADRNVELYTGDAVIELQHESQNTFSVPVIGE
jgi:hypothetical protein